MAKDYGLSFTPIFIVNLCSVFRCDRIHKTSPYLEVDVCQLAACVIQESWRSNASMVAKTRVFGSQVEISRPQIPSKDTPYFSVQILRVVLPPKTWVRTRR